MTNAAKRCSALRIFREMQMRRSGFHFIPIYLLAWLAEIRMLATDALGGGGGKNWEPSDPAGGRERGRHGHPGETSGAISEISTQRPRIQGSPCRDTETPTDSSTRRSARTRGLSPRWGSGGSSVGQKGNTATPTGVIH